MKRILGASLIVAALLLPVEGRSQVAPKPAGGTASAREGHVSFGPWVGANLSSFGGKDATGLKSRTALAAGGALQFGLGPNAFLRTGALYSQRGADVDLSGSGISGSGGIHLTYLEVPVVLGLRPSGASSFRPFVMVGGHVGFKLGCKIEASGSGTTASINCDDPSVGADIRSVDLAVAGGAGVMLSAGRGTVTIDARYSLGLQSIDNTSPSPSDVKNRGFTVGLAYLMPLGK